MVDLDSLEKCIVCHIGFFELINEETDTELSNILKVRINELLSIWIKELEKKEVLINNDK